MNAYSCICFLSIISLLATLGHRTLNGQIQDNNVRVPYRTYINEHQHQIPNKTDECHIILFLMYLLENFEHVQNQNLPQDKADTNEYQRTRTACIVRI